jgi:hypothetical protein
MNEIIPIKNLIYEIRGHKIMLDNDLATLYGVETKVLNQAVKRNADRFPEDFMFQLTQDEWEVIRVRSQIVTSPKGGGRQYLPYVFTEQGVSMLSSVLKSKQAITVNVQIMRTFVKMRQFALENKDLSERLAMVEKYLMQYSKDNNAEIDKINEAINYLLDITKPAQIGFKG